jgi:hypothetical protein
MTGSFCLAVGLLRALPERYRVMALHAAMYWSDERCDDEERIADLLGQPDEVAQPKAAPVLKLVSSDRSGRS